MLSKGQVKNVKQLHQKKFRNELGLFIAEGPKVVEEFLHSDIKITEIYGLKNWIAKNMAILTEKKCVYFSVDEQDLERISALQTPSEVLAVCKQTNFSVKDINPAPQLFLYLDGLADPGNLGTVIRMAEWFGLGQVFLSPSSAEVFNPKVVQSSMGSLSRIKTFYLSLADVLRHSGAKQVLGAELKGEDIYSITLPDKCILVIGSESHGISDTVKKQLTKSISIPAAKSSKAESLNAATATSIILAEFFRKNNFAK